MTNQELKALLKLCRTEGVLEITINDTHIKFGDKPMAKPRGKAQAQEEIQAGPTEEEIALWSVGQ